jgi:hypothetical protein
MLLDRYLYYVQERQWDEETENPDTFDPENYKKVFGDLIGLGPLEKTRHALQPSMYNIYLKNSLGDYKGRPDSINNQTVRNIGIKDFEEDKERITKLSKQLNKKHLYPDLEDEGDPNSGDVEEDDGDGGDGGGGE